VADGGPKRSIELTLQPRPRSMEPHAEGSATASGGAGRSFGVEAIPCDKQESLTRTFGEPHDRRDEAFFHFGDLGLILLGLDNFFCQSMIERLPAPRTPPAVRNVAACRPEEPGHRVVRDLVQPPPSGQERLCNHIVDVVGRHPTGGVPCHCAGMDFV
jgi:hypothetical protein